MRDRPSCSARSFHQPNNTKPRDRSLPPSLPSRPLLPPSLSRSLSLSLAPYLALDAMRPLRCWESKTNALSTSAGSTDGALAPASGESRNTLVRPGASIHAGPALCCPSWQKPGPVWACCLVYAATQNRYTVLLRPTCCLCRPNQRRDAVGRSMHCSEA